MKINFCIPISSSDHEFVLGQGNASQSLKIIILAQTMFFPQMNE